MRLSEAFPFIPLGVHHLVDWLPVTARMSGTDSLCGEIPLRKIPRFQGDVCCAQNPLPEIVEAVVNMLLMRSVEASEPAGHRLADAAQAVQLVEHCDRESALVGPEANVVVPERCGVQPLYVRLGVRQGVMYALFDRHFNSARRDGE
jgi:hypothetical protein